MTMITALQYYSNTTITGQTWLCERLCLDISGGSE